MINKIINHIRQGTLTNAVYKKAIGKEKRIKLNGYKRTLCNIVRYGWAAPRFGELLWVYPHKHTKILVKDDLKRLAGTTNKDVLKGRVVTGWTSEELLERSFDITDYPKERFCIKDWNKETLNDAQRISYRFKFCVEHFVYGISWEDTGVYEAIENEIVALNFAVDGCKNRDDVVKRYNELDLIFEQVKKEGRFRKQNEIDKAFKSSRKHSQLMLLIGPNNNTFLHGGGWHRFAIGYILQLPVPAMISCVHESAIPYLKKYRKSLIP